MIIVKWRIQFVNTAGECTHQEPKLSLVSQLTPLATNSPSISLVSSCFCFAQTVFWRNGKGGFKRFSLVGLQHISLRRRLPV